MVSENLVNIDSGNDLLIDGTKPLAEPVLTYHQWGSAVSILKFTGGAYDIKS